MNFKILALCVFVFLIGCGQKDAAPAKPVSLTTYSVMDSARLNEFFELDERRKIDKEFSAKIDKVLNDVRKMKNNERNKDGKEISYKVCFSNIDGFVLRHPCTLDSALLVNIVKRFNFSDSVRALKANIDFIAYSNSGEYADYSEMYLNEDGSIETNCLSREEKKCNDLYAQVSVSKKLFPENVLAEFHDTWPREQFDVRIDESSFIEKFKIEDFLSSVYKERLEHRYYMPQRRHQMNQKDSLIPFEMCYENGIAIPCNLSKRDQSRIRKAIEKEGDTLAAVTYQRCFMWNDFVLDAISSKHYCNSKDGTHCSELSALVHRNKDAEVLPGHLVLYRFDLNDFSYAIEELGHGDLMWFDYNELYKKDGTHIGREKIHY